MSHPAINLCLDPGQPIGHSVVELQSVDSTNNYAMAQVHAGLASHGMVYMAQQQLAGRGQRGKKWETAPGQNLTLSIALTPGLLKLKEHFMLNAAVALGCRDFLCSLVPDPEEIKIKWPNDLYWRDRKAGGILMESVSKGHDWLFAIAGIGINVNQVSFPEYLPNPVSIKKITGREYWVPNLAALLFGFMESRYRQLLGGEYALLLADYNQVLYKRGESVHLRKENMVFDTIISHVQQGGQLITHDSIERSFEFGEVLWTIF